MQTRIIIQVTVSVMDCGSTPLAALRAQLTAHSFCSFYLTAAGQIQTNYPTHDCQNPARLTRWLRNPSAALTRRGTA